MSERTITQRDLAKALVRAEDKNFNESSIMALAFPPLEPRTFRYYDYGDAAGVSYPAFYEETRKGLFVLTKEDLGPITLREVLEDD